MEYFLISYLSLNFSSDQNAQTSIFLELRREAGIEGIALFLFFF